MKAGLTVSALTFPIASSSVLSTFGLAGLSKPTWLSLICRKVSGVAACALASPTMPSERGTPPAIVHSTPVPAQVMHSSTLRRLIPAPLRSSSDVIVLLPVSSAPRTGGDRTSRRFIPGARLCLVAIPRTRVAHILFGKPVPTFPQRYALVAVKALFHPLASLFTRKQNVRVTIQS